jgi:hypothetical protein
MRLVGNSFVCLCIACGNAPLLAQPAPLEPGASVRITAPDCDAQAYKATYEGIRGDTLVASGFTTLRCPTAAVTKLELYAGRRSNTWRGAGIGFLAGTAAGFAVWHLAIGACYEGAAVNDCALVLGGGIGGLGGALVGAVVGAFVKTDRWRRIPPDRFRIQPAVTPGGFGFTARVGF